MKNLTLFLLSGVLLLGTVACKNPAKTSADAPNSTQESAKVPAAQTVKNSQEDAQSQMRRNQLNSDIRAHEQRNNAFNQGSTNRTDAAVITEVRSKLEANIPKSQLTIDAKDGVVTVTGSVPNQQDINKVEPLARQIKGVKSVVNKVTYLPPKAK